MSTEKIIGIDFNTSISVVRAKPCADGKSESVDAAKKTVVFENQDIPPTASEPDKPMLKKANEMLNRLKDDDEK